jgi:hypothetical protein
VHEQRSNLRPPSPLAQQSRAFAAHGADQQLKPVWEAPATAAAAACEEEPADSSSQLDREMLLQREQMLAVLALNRLINYLASP